MSSLQNRINYKGDLKPALQQVCTDFDLGEFQSYKEIHIGYEDFNLELQTSRGEYFVKIFGSFRQKSDCQNYVDVIVEAIRAGIAHPTLYNSNQGYLYEFRESNTKDWLCVMEYISGGNFHELGINPTEDDIKFIVRETCKINQLNLRPPFVYDTWAITSFKQEFEKKKGHLNTEDLRLIEPLLKIYDSLSIETLPHCLVHGDIIRTNVMKRKDGQVFIIDFAVANYYPRLQELAVLLCDFCFDPNDPQNLKQRHDLVLSEYQKAIPLRADEITKLPNYLKLAHAMHLMNASYEKTVNNNAPPENEYFLNIGRIGLQYTTTIWPN